MRYSRYILWVLLCVVSITAYAQEKRPMSHDDYAAWNAISGVKLSPDGNKIIYSLTPQRGDARMIIGTTDGAAQDTIYRATRGDMAYDGSYTVAVVKAPFAVTREMKIAKKKADDMPKDTLYIKKWGEKDATKYAPVTGYKKGSKAVWLAWQWDKEKPVKDTAKKKPAKTPEKVAENPAPKKETAATDTTKKKKTVEKKPQGKKLSITHPTVVDSIYTFQSITEYETNITGSHFLMVELYKDSIEHSRVLRFDTRSLKTDTLLSAAGKASKIALDSLGQAAFLFSQDTAKIKTYELYYASVKDKKANTLKGAYSHLLPDSTVVVSENATPYFSADGARLFFGIGEKEKKAPKDTLLTEEKARFDLWSWTDMVLQPQQLLEKDREKKRTYTCLYTIKTGKAVQIADENLERVSVPNRNRGKYALAAADKPYRLDNSRNGTSRRDIYIVEVETGKRTLLMSDVEHYPMLSPDAKYIAYFDRADSSYYAIDRVKGTRVNISAGIEGDVLYNVDDDHIAYPVSEYGALGWTTGDKHLLVYGKYNVWQLDPTGKTVPQNITRLTPRSEDAYVKLTRFEPDPERRHISVGDKLYFTALDKENKDGGYYSMVYGSGEGAKPIVMEPKYYYSALKAEKAEKYIIRHCTFGDYPELRAVSSLENLSDQKLLSRANPVMDSLLWGSEELFSWTTADGEKQVGVLYKPEGFDPKRKYPVIVYFYETYTDDLHRFYTPAPSYSTVNFPFFVSNDYIIFIPDIKYAKDGYPGRSAEKSIISGTLALIDEGYVNPKAIGIQGQSWGGYQVAYLVTRTNMFAAAGAGAPVSNMTSAYDGIRWESGRSRNIQYEKGQSRIGGTLWERPWHYIENSPLFFAPEVETPLFIMHNDADGAVPWYQGIEYFVALRRLGKPVWMINYNGDSHNLRPASWGNRMDLSRRLEQFFDHFLKGKPAPQWIKEGIPAVKKGETYGY